LKAKGFQTKVDFNRPKIPSPSVEGGGSTFPPQGGRRLRFLHPIAKGTSPKGEGFQPSPKGTLKFSFILQKFIPYVYKNIGSSPNELGERGQGFEDSRVQVIDSLKVLLGTSL